MGKKEIPINLLNKFRKIFTKAPEGMTPGLRETHIDPRAKAALVNEYSEVAAGKTLTNLLSARRALNAERAAASTNSLWNRLFHPERIARANKELKNADIRLRGDMKNVADSDARLASRTHALLGYTNEKPRIAISTRQPLISEVAQETRDFANLPKNLRNAFSANQNVYPARGYKMQNIIQNNYIPKAFKSSDPFGKTLPPIEEIRAALHSGTNLPQ